MSKLLHLTRPGFAQSISQGHFGIADRAHDLIRCARDDDKDVYAGADVTPKAPHVDGQSSYSFLLAQARDGDDRAVEALAKIDDERVPGTLVSLLEDSECEVVEAACRALADHPDASAVVPLINLMSKSPAGIDIDLPMYAIIEVGEEAVPILLDLLNNSKSDAVREQAAYALSENFAKSECLGREESREAIVQALGDSVSDAVVPCIHLLETWKRFEPLVGLLTHHETEVRQEAGRALCAIDKDRAVVEFVRVLGDEGSGVAKDASNHLVALGEPAVPTLVDGFAGADIYKRERIRVALRKIVSSSGAGPTIYMRERFGDADVDVRRGVLRTLLDITLRHLAVSIKDVFQDSDAAIRMMLVERMKTFGVPEHIAALESLSSDPDKGVREEALEAIRLIHQREQDGIEAEAAQKRQVAAEAAARVAEMEREASAAERKIVHERIEAITQGIIVSLSTILGLKYNLRASAMDSEYVHASVLAFEEDEHSPDSHSRYAMRILPAITVDAGPTVEYAREILRTLNFLVHHELAHALQIQRKLQEPELNVRRYSHFDDKFLIHYANEMLMDRLAFDMGANLYVHGDGDAVFDRAIREVIVISAFNMLATLMNSDAEERGRVIIAPAAARMVATLRELAMSSVITRKMQDGLRTRAKAFYVRATGSMDANKMKQFDCLIKAYRKIFRDSSLEV